MPNYDPPGRELAALAFSLIFIGRSVVCVCVSVRKGREGFTSVEIQTQASDVRWIQIMYYRH